MDIEDIAVGITKIDENTYQWPQNQLRMALGLRTSSAEKLSLWHSRLGHLNFVTLRTYLKQLHINFLDDFSRQFVCGPCELSKAKKRYNRSPRPTP